ncbi:hypothetical protein ACH492_30715 [Streptomyces sp. NPDC019443]|uniref:hypothetical protein n=1 Tax=Streptomyces sp. NPDC019443 TaxID=3365061 RepID=UPI003788D814
MGRTEGGSGAVTSGRAYCGSRLGERPDARSGEDWLNPAWTEAIERHRERRTRAVEGARRRVQPDAVTDAVPAPRPTSRMATAGRSAPGPARGGRLWWAAGAAVLAVGLAVALVVRPWEGGGIEARNATDKPVRIS